MRRLLILAGGAGIVLLVGAYLLLSNRPEPEYAGPVASDRQQLSDVDGDRIVAMELAPRGGETIRLEREGAVWLVREPYPFRWDWPRLQELRASFASLFAQRLVVEDPEDRAQYGLDPPLVVASARLESGETFEFHLGNRTSSGEAYFLSSRDDRAVFTVHAVHGTRFSWTVADLRDQTMPALTRDRVNRIWFRDGDHEVELVAVGEQPRYAHLGSAQVMRIPYLAAADEERFASIARRVAEMPISDVVADNPSGYAEFGLDPPRGELRVRDFEDELHLLLGATVGGRVYVKMPAAKGVHTVPAAALEFLSLTPFELSDPRVLDVPVDRMNSILFRSGEREHRIDLRRATDDLGAEQVTLAVDGRPLDQESFALLSEEIANLAVDAPAPAGRDAPDGDPVLTITYHLRGGGRYILVARFLPYDQDFNLLVLDESIDLLVDRRAVSALAVRIETTLGEWSEPHSKSD